MFDPEKFGEAMGAAIREAVAPLQKRIGELEAQLAKAVDIPAEIERAVSAAVAAIPAPKDGKSADMDAVARLVEEAVKALPLPKDGASVTVEDVAPLIHAEIGKKLEDVPQTIADEVQRTLSAWDRPKDGASVTLADVLPVVDEAVKAIKSEAEAAVGSAIAGIRVPEDGKSVSVDDLSGVLETAVNRWALEFERRAQDTFQKAVDRIPKPKDGVDGVGFDDLQVEYDGERGVTLKFVRGEVTKEALITIPVVLDRGIFKEGQSYEAGDGVTWGGSFWIAQSKTAAKPDSGEGWRLAVKRGRDGKDGRDGIDKTAPVKL